MNTRVRGVVVGSRLAYEYFKGLDIRHWRKQIEIEFERAETSIERREEELRTRGGILEPWHRVYLEQRLLEEYVRYWHAYAGRVIMLDMDAAVLLEHFLAPLSAMGREWRESHSFEGLVASGDPLLKDLERRWLVFAELATPIAIEVLAGYMKNPTSVPPGLILAMKRA